MARKEDASKDRPSKQILNQLDTFTVGPPPASTNKIGDQTPSNVFDVAKFDQVKNQVVIDLNNLEALNVLNTIGQVSGTQSQSGPLVSSYNNPTFTLKSASQSSNDTVTWFRPDPGQVWQLMAAAVVVDNAGHHNMYLTDDAGTDLYIAQETSNVFFDNTVVGQNIFISYDLYLRYNIGSGASGTSVVRAAFCRVR
jgi:hypothetical protein